MRTASGLAERLLQLVSRKDESTVRICRDWLTARREVHLVFSSVYKDNELFVN
jgi:hypothetical protein